MNAEAIKLLDQIQFHVDEIRKLITSETSNTSGEKSSVVSVSQANSSPVKRVSPTGRKPKIQTAESLPADQLGSTPDPALPDWPEAVMPHMIVTHKGAVEKQFRALQIARLLGNFDNQTVLDVGCDEGYITKEIGHNAKKVIGYDLKSSDIWPKLASDNVLFTDDKVAVEAERYDTILLYDVLDHLVGVEPIKFMTWLNSLLAPGGKIFVRTHPWTAKHGGHLYEHGFNKAFLHLALTPDELVQLGIDLPASLKFNRPMATYEHIFIGSGLKIAERKGHTEPVDSFFSGSILDRIIKVTWKGAIDPAAALKIMANSFVDYTLKAE